MSAFALLPFALGAIIGSFLNVVIHRVPREESVVWPGSHCPSCGAAIRAFDNVPVLSFLWLGGRCRDCRSPIGFRYPIVELVNALFYVAIWQRTGPTVFFLPVAALVSATIVLIYIDLDVQLLPDVITIPGTVVGVIAGAMQTGALVPELWFVRSWQESVLGAVIGASTILLIIAAYWLWRRVQGMGWGDVKMMAMIGAFTGWQLAVLVLLAGAFLGAIVGLPVALRQKEGMQYALPFGVFLGIALLGVVFFGESLVWTAPLLLQR
jgi:leader peptidase (prepilin peptidase) / N-methyltransferase